MDRKALRKGGRALDSSGLGQAQLMVSCEHCNKMSISIKCREFVNLIWNHLLFGTSFCRGFISQLFSEHLKDSFRIILITRSNQYNKEEFCSGTEYSVLHKCQ